MNVTSETGRFSSCPICGRRAVEKFRPFCSRRCADIDLHRWLGGVYAIPGKAEEEEDEMPGAASLPAQKEDWN